MKEPPNRIYAFCFFLLISLPSSILFYGAVPSHGTKSKALVHFRDGGAADSTEPVVREGELHVKVTLIDGKRSADRSWRTVHAVLRGHHLKLTLVREGKNSNQVRRAGCGGGMRVAYFILSPSRRV